MTPADSQDAPHPAAQRPPSLDRLLAGPALQSLIEAHGRGPVMAAARAQLARWRASVPAQAFERAQFESGCKAMLDALAAPHLRPVFNLTGTVLHTNLGRAPAPPEAVRAVADAMAGPSNLEYDLAAAGAVTATITSKACCASSPAPQAATAVNNNAAAVLLVLAPWRGQGGAGLARRARRDRRRLPHSRTSCAAPVLGWWRWAPPTAPTCATTPRRSARARRW
jgi:hypothetical protein